MEKIQKRVKFMNLGMTENEFENFEVYRILNEKYQLVTDCDNPDYIITAMFGKPYSYCNFPGVRIFYSGENFSPDFNLVDYAIGYDDIKFGDRYIRHGDCFSRQLAAKDRNYSSDILKEKTHFASFSASHESEHNIRGDFFKKLCQYKRVDSFGSYLNNMPDGQTVARADKFDFQRKCKFNLCFESTSHRDFCTEKLVDAFLADSIPVYYGDPNVCKLFNSKAFINCADFESFDDVIEYIKELDSDDEKYLSVLRQPIYSDDGIIERHYEELKAFLFNIFDQPIDKAYRRSKVYMPNYYCDILYKAFNCARKKKKVLSVARIKTKMAKAFPRLFEKIKITQLKRNGNRS